MQSGYSAQPGASFGTSAPRRHVDSSTAVEDQLAGNTPLAKSRAPSCSRRHLQTREPGLLVPLSIRFTNVTREPVESIRGRSHRVIEMRIIWWGLPRVRVGVSDALIVGSIPRYSTNLVRVTSESLAHTHVFFLPSARLANTPQRYDRTRSVVEISVVHPCVGDMRGTGMILVHAVTCTKGSDVSGAHTVTRIE